MINIFGIIEMLYVITHYELAYAFTIDNEFFKDCDLSKRLTK